MAVKICLCVKCGENDFHVAKGLCRRCYQRQYEHLSITCSSCNENKPHEAKGMCSPCYYKQHCTKQRPELRICSPLGILFSKIKNRGPKMDFLQWKNEIIERAHKQNIPIDISDSIFVSYWNNGYSIEQVLLSQWASGLCNSNIETVKKATKCGCFHCLAIFNTRKITEFEESVRCPYCKIDSVLAETNDCIITKRLLEKVYEVRFSKLHL